MVLSNNNATIIIGEINISTNIVAEYITNVYNIIYIMNIIDFIQKHELPHRKITYKYINGKKVPIGEHNDYTLQQINNDRGIWVDGIKAYSIHIKYVPDLYCIDFDEKQIEKSELYKILKITNRFDEHKADFSKDYVKIKELALTDKQLKTIKKWMEEKIQETFVNVNSDSSYCDFAYNWMKK